MDRLLDILNGEEPSREIFLERNDARKEKKVKKLEVKPLFEDGDDEQIIISNQTTNSKTKVMVLSGSNFITDIFKGDTLISKSYGEIIKYVKVKKEK